MNEPYTVWVPVDWYSEAVDAINKLRTLETHGVANWPGYADAMRCAELGRCDTCE